MTANDDLEMRMRIEDLTGRVRLLEHFIAFLLASHPQCDLITEADIDFLEYLERDARQAAIEQRHADARLLRAQIDGASDSAGRIGDLMSDADAVLRR